MIELRNREELVYFFDSKISLSKKDKRFIGNLISNNLTKSGEITTAQDELLDKLVDKYHRQLSGLVKLAMEVRYLEWKNIKLLTTDSAIHIHYLDDTIVLQSRYHQRLVSKLGKLQCTKSFNPIDKEWHFDFSPLILKELIAISNAYTDRLILSDNIKEFVSRVEHYDGIEWVPTIKMVNGAPFISCINQFIQDAMSNCDLSSMSTWELMCFARKHAINLHDSVIESDDAIMNDFVTSLVTKSSVDDLPALIEMMSATGVNKAYLIGSWASMLVDGTNTAVLQTAISLNFRTFILPRAIDLDAIMENNIVVIVDSQTRVNRLKENAHVTKIIKLQ